MGLYETIYKLQRKPEREKKKILIALVLASFVLIVGIWLLIFKSQISSPGYSSFENNNNFVKQEESKDANMPGPVSQLKEGVGFVFSDLVSIATDFLEKNNEAALPPTETMEDMESRPTYRLPIN